MANEPTVRVFAPASIGNVACGFDVLGLALEHPGDEVVARLSEKSGVRITEITGDEGRLPRDPQVNTASIAAGALLRSVDTDYGVELQIHKNMPMGSGLGSSAASAVAGAVATNSVIGNPFSRGELLPFTLEAEKVACGSAHPDNVAASLFGGIALFSPGAPPDIINLPVPDELYCTLIRPHIEIKTGDSRDIMATTVPLARAVEQMGYLGGFIAALYESDYELISRCLRDVIAEPARSVLIPGFEAVKKAAMQAGALGCSISGAGPSIFSLSRGEERAISVCEAMDAALFQLDIEATSFVSPVNRQGATIISETYA